MATSNDSRGQLIFFIMLAVAVLIWLTSCMTPQKATSYLKENGMLDDTCAANFPVIPDTVYKEGELVIETTYLPGDTIYNYDTVQQLQEVYVTAPTKVITRHKVDTLVRTVVDSAAVSAAKGTIKALEQELKQQQVELAKVTDKAKDRGKTSLYSIIGNGLLLLLLGFILAKKRKV